MSSELCYSVPFNPPSEWRKTLRAMIHAGMQALAVEDTESARHVRDAVCRMYHELSKKSIPTENMFLGARDGREEYIKQHMAAFARALHSH